MYVSTTPSLRYLFVLMLILLQSALAQGILQGTVSDSTNQEVLVGANILLKGTPIGGISDIEGRFRVANIPEGKYVVRIAYLGYKTKELAVTIVSGQNVIVNAPLAPDVIEGQEVVITAQARGQLSAMNQQLKSVTMTNVISEEKIKELPDANAAEAIGRLPGVSLIRSGGEANKVILRGMSDKFARVTIDGVGMASTDSNARGIDLSMIAQGTLSGVELNKSLTPDKDADAIAGSINLVTKRAPFAREIRVDAKGNYNALKPTFKQYDFSMYYGERFFEDVLGFQFTGNLEAKDRSNEKVNIDYDFPAVEQGTGRELDWGIDDVVLTYTDEQRKRNGASFFFDYNTPDSGSIRFNNVYSSTDRNILTHLRDYPVGASTLVSNANGVSYIYKYSEQQIKSYNSSLRGDNHLFDFDIIWGASFSQSEALIPFEHELQFTETSNLGISGMKPIPPTLYHGPPEEYAKYAYNNFGKSTLSWGFFNDKRNLDKERTLYLDISKKYYFGDIFSGDLKFGGKYKNKNRIKNSRQEFSPYYTQDYNYIRQSDGSFVKKNYDGTIFDPLKKDGSLVLFTNFFGANPARRSIFDKFDMYPLINTDAIKDWYDLNKDGYTNAGGVPEYADNPLEIGNYYDVTERVTSGYIMNTLNIGEEMTLILGGRIEKESNDYRARYSLGTISGFPVPQGKFKDTLTTYSESNFMPHLHFTIRPTDFMNVRVAAYKALARPDFSSRLATFVADGSTWVVLGNPSLKSAKAWNYELNTSFFGKTIGLISLSAFYKEIEDLSNTTNRLVVNNQPLTNGKTFFDSLGIKFNNPFGNNQVSLRLNVPYNSSKLAKVWGFEVEHQANLNFLPGYLQYIVLSYNFSIVRSEQHLMTWKVYTTSDTVQSPFGPVITPTSHNYYELEKNKLFNQPEFFGNVSVGYDIGGFSARLSLFYQDEFPRSYSQDGRNESITNKFSRWDLSVKHQATENVAILLTVNNLNDFEEGTSSRHTVEPYWTLQTSRQRYGITGDLGVRINL
ncbi:MAG: TonB-dependent receptor domain-containing protein [Bacteroidota bacterium]